MENFHLPDSFTLTLVKALCGLFCPSVYNEIQFTVGPILHPQSLDEDIYKLKSLFEDIRVMMSSEAIDKWIDKAFETIRQIDQLWLQEISGSSNHNDDHRSSCLYDDACYRYNLHKEIKRIIARGEIIRRLTLLRREAVVRIDDVSSIEDGTTAERNLKQVIYMLNDPDVWCIGVWGPGGVGKTTLVGTLYNKLDSDSPFSLVELIELKPNDGDSEVQEAIAKSLGLNMGEGIEDHIRNTLRRKKFLLILDNLWKPIDLRSVGIPTTQKGSKIILATRLKSVCTKMDARAIEMGYPTEVEAWRLSADEAGVELNDERIKPLAREVLNTCGKLPLALDAMGSAFRGGTNINTWRNAANEVCNPLKERYNLLDGTQKACFLYCSLYPQGYYIDINELVECWIAEKLIDEKLCTHGYDKGLSLIERLEEFDLLEQGIDGEYWEPKTVKMADEAYDLARRIRESDKRSIVNPTVTVPEEAKSFPWMSFEDNGEIKIPEFWEDYCSATTLLLRKTSYEDNMKVSTNFVKCFQAVKVLNMERVHSFAASHLQLEKLHALILRNCSNLDELPIADNLEILDLSNNMYLRKTPRGTNQSNLKVLNLSCTPYLKRIDADTIHKLIFLEILIMCESGYLWPIRKRSISEGATLQDLSELQQLKEVYLELAEADGTYNECGWLERLKCFYFSYDCPASSRYRRKTLNINMRSLDTEVGSLILHANELILYHVENDRNRLVSSLSVITNALGKNFSGLRSLQIRESAVVVFSKDDQQHITLPQLESLSVYGCRKEVAFDCGPAVIQAIAPNLRILELYDSERLESLCNCDQKEKWISLKMLKVMNCNRLKKFPLVPNMEEIRGSIEWRDSIEWQSEDTKLLMNNRFKPL